MPTLTVHLRLNVYRIEVTQILTLCALGVNARPAFDLSRRNQFRQSRSVTREGLTFQAAKQFPVSF